jgi:hypothetical protein
MRTPRLLHVLLLLLPVASCGGSDPSGFDVKVKVRGGLNLAAMSELEVSFQSAGDARFSSRSGSELQGQIHYQTNDGGRSFAAVADRDWIVANYELEKSEFVFRIPFVNPSGGGHVNLRGEVRRQIGADMVKVGESVIVPFELPADPGSDVEVVVGCIEGGQCGAELLPDGGPAGEPDAAAPGPDSGVDGGADAS